jgi:transcriptional regulator with XRE-family HTH domain
MRTMVSTWNGRAPTGLDLRLRRTVAHVTQTVLAEEIGVARPQISQWEAALWPSAAACERYMAALDRLTERGVAAAADPAPADQGAMVPAGFSVES